MAEETSKSNKNNDSSNKSNFPPDLESKMRDFHSSLENIEKIVEPLLDKNAADIREKLQPLDQARYTITSAYMLNSLYWMYLKTKNIDPQEHDIKHEMDRIKNYMLRMKEITDKPKAPKIDSKAAQRFVRSSLWQPSDKNEVEESQPSQSDKNPKKKKRVN